MPAQAARPKQRQLIRWNDDLDKSLLLFIAHTCTEVGIKIPYNEVARRMGSIFSEGAIIQHIAKLRTKMHALNVAPVPGPPKRGQIASKPSSVYSSPARSGPSLNPPPPPPVTPKGRGRESSAKPTGVTKRKARKSRGIKRSESDPEDSSEENMQYDGTSPPVATRGRRTGGQAKKGRRVSAEDAGPSEEFDFPDYTVATQGQQAMPYTSIEQNQQQDPYDYGQFASYNQGEYIGEEEEEEEDDDTNAMMAQNAALHGQAYQFRPHDPNSHNVSPKSNTQMNLPLHNPPSSTISGQERSSFSFSNGYQNLQMPQPRSYSASTIGNFDYTTYNPDTVTNSPSANRSQFSTMASPAFPKAVHSTLPAPPSSQTSSRNDSLASQTGTYGTPTMINNTLSFGASQGIDYKSTQDLSAQRHISPTTHDDLVNQSFLDMPQAPVEFDYTTGFPNFDLNDFNSYSHNTHAEDFLFDGAAGDGQ